MNLEDVRHFMAPIALVCAFGVLLNLFMLRKRGTSAALLAGAFLSLGIALILFSARSSTYAIVPFGALVLILLIVDFLLRIKNLGGQR